MRLLRVPALAVSMVVLMGADCCDLDGDGQCDNQDPCGDSGAHDDDLDIVCSDVDNCPDVYNPEQSDFNGNGIGDACEEEPEGPNEVLFFFMGIGREIGEYGGTVSDIDGDGRNEILLSNGLGVAYTLEWDGEGYSRDRSYSTVFNVESVAAGDINGDGTHSVFVSSDGVVVRLNGRTGEIEGMSESLDPLYTLLDAEVADLDGDGHFEVVGLLPLTYGVYGDKRIVVLDAESLTVEWESEAYEDIQDIAVGDVLGTSDTLEIVTNTGQVVAPFTGEVPWQYPIDFGVRVSIGDVNGDGKNEIVSIASWDLLTAYDAELGTPLWEVVDLGDLSCLHVANVDETPRAEIIIGAGQHGDMMMFDGLTMEETWRIRLAGHGSTEVFAGDGDGDGVIEVFWGTYANGGASDSLIVSEPGAESYEWDSGSQPTGYFVPGGLGDYNGDGRLEFVVGAWSSGPEGTGPSIYAFDQLTQDEVASTSALQARDDEEIVLASGDYDGDGTTDLAIGNRSPFIELYDLFDDRVTWTSDTMGEDIGRIKFRELRDGMALIASFKANIHIFRPPATAPILSTTSVSGYIDDFDVCDLNGDGQPNLVVTNGSLWTFDVGTELITFSDSLVDRSYEGVFCRDLDGDGSVELVVWSRPDAYSSHFIAVLDGESLEVLAEMDIPDEVGVSAVGASDFDQDGIAELAVTYERFFDESYDGAWVEILDSQTLAFLATTGVIYDVIRPQGLMIEDVNGDGTPDLEIGGGGFFQVLERP